MLLAEDALNKRINGQYFTESNPFKTKGFYNWAEVCSLPFIKILEPFAGSNNLIKMLKEMDLCGDFVSYDIKPESPDVLSKDTLLDFPKDFAVCITNPPYLARNSAKRRGLNYPQTEFDDLYKFALDKALQNCKYVGAIIPASFLNASLFRERLSHYILLNSKMFNETEHPVCLALFKPFAGDTEIFEGERYLGLLSDFEKKIPKSKKTLEMKFNSGNGKLGLFAIDDTNKPSIRFCNGENINSERIGISSRSITRIAIECNVDKLIKKANEFLRDFRNDTHDIFLTPFKGLRKDNKYRRRLDYALAREIINNLVLDCL